MLRTTTSARLAVETLEARELPATMFGLTIGGRLLTFDSNTPSVIQKAVTISGFPIPGEVITDIDVRPGSGVLFGRSNADRLYTINPVTGVATGVGGFVNTLAQHIGMDFDPTTDQLRLVSNIGENLAINPNNGSVLSIGQSLSYLPGDFVQGQPPRITGLAFTNSLPFALTTTAFGIDHRLNTLVQFTGSLNNGQLFTVASLGIDVTALVGFDIAAGSTVGFAALQQSGVGPSIFTQINLITGATFSLGQIGNFRVIRDIALLSGAAFPTPTFLPPNTFLRFGSPGFFPPVTQPFGPGLVSPLGPGLVAPAVGTTGPNITFGTGSGTTFTTGGSTTSGAFSPFTVF